MKRLTDLLWSITARLWSQHRRALYFVQPRTITLWQQKRFRDCWRALSQSSQPRRPQIAPELRKLIKRMWQANPTWGSSRIITELQKLGIEVAQSTVEKYKPRARRPPSSTGRTFLDQHLEDLVAVDFLVVPTVAINVLFVFLVPAPDRRRIVHFNVTAHPTARGTSRQIVEAFPFDTAPRYLLRDRDAIDGERFRRLLHSLGIAEVPAAPRSPWQPPCVERLIGCIRREYLDHVIVFNERHLRRILGS